jgi:hypothetical protein
LNTNANNHILESHKLHQIVNQIFHNPGLLDIH